MDDHAAQLWSLSYQYSRAIYRSIKNLIDPYADRSLQIEYRRAVLCECERTMERLAEDHYFARPDRALFADIRRYFPITAQAQVAWSVRRASAPRPYSSSSRSRPGPRRRRGTVPRDDTQGQGLSADAAPEPRLLPVASAPRARNRRRLTPRPPAAPGWGAALRHRLTTPASPSAGSRPAGARPADKLAFAWLDADKLIRQLSSRS